MDATNNTKPLLIYDGDCGFCKYSVRYWHQLTGDKVEYKPYQEVADQYPQIPREAFKRAIQYVAPDGKISSAAKASFLTVSHAKGRGLGLWLYKKLPGFAFISEKVYAFIAAHRSVFYYISIILWGRDPEPPRYQLTAWLFLRILGLLYLAAFISFGTQALGLIGSRGIIPIADAVTHAEAHMDAARYWYAPMLFWLNSSDFMIQAICWGGALFSLLLIFNRLPRVSLIILYVLYLSLIYAGQYFMTFQWDLYLLETGVIAIFLISSTTMGIWLLRWLLFRFMLAGGLVKLLSGDSTWQTLTALRYYFNTEPLPTPLAWYANQLPARALSIGAAATLIIEVILPFFIFLPRHLRFVAAGGFLILQTLITLTGNYNFFNLLTIALCLVLFDDATLRKIIPARLLSRLPQPKKPYKIMSIFTYAFALITVFVSIVQFQLRFIGHAPAPAIWVGNAIEPLHLVSTYGPFAVMTTQRLEIIIEGSDDGINWREYAFKYKPGDVNRRPPWNIPHQPRLDWQMWFAALTTADDTPWFPRFIQRLLENSPDVLALLKTNPFPDHAPRYIRAQFYDYNFTTYEEKAKTGAWWNRRYVMVYFPQVSLRS